MPDDVIAPSSISHSNEPNQDPSTDLSSVNQQKQSPLSPASEESSIDNESIQSIKPREKKAIAKKSLINVVLTDSEVEELLNQEMQAFVD